MRGAEGLQSQILEGGGTHQRQKGPDCQSADGDLVDPVNTRILIGACASTVSHLQSFATIRAQREKCSLLFLTHSMELSKIWLKKGGGGEGLQRPPQDLCGTNASFVFDFTFSVPHSSQSEGKITFAVLGGTLSGSKQTRRAVRRH